MMRVRAGSALVVVLLAIAGHANAAYDVGSSLTADAPVALTGRGESELLQGIAAFVSNDRRAPTSVSVTAEEVWFEHRAAQSACTPTFPGIPCGATSSTPADDRGHLRDARVTVTPLDGWYKVLVTNDPAYLGEVEADRGAIVAGLGGTSRLDTIDEARFLSPYQAGWTDTTTDVTPLYQVDALTPYTTTGGDNSLAATGNFEALLQGFRVRLTGTTDDGAAFDETYDAPAPSSNGQGGYFLLEAREGELNALSPAPLEAYVVHTVKILSGGSASFTGANGRVVTDGAPTEYAGESVRLTGPLALQDIEVADGSPARMSFRITSDLASSDEPSDVQQLAAAAAAGAGGAGLLAAAAYFWPRLKYGLTLAALPLYTRIERTQVLEHAKRDEIYELIRSAPGIHAHEIGERANIGWGTTVYHLKMLESHNLVVSKKSGRYKRFYVNTGEYTKVKDVYAALRNETAKAVAEYIVNHPGTSQKDLCAAVGIQPSLASWHVDKLEGVGLVKRVKDGRQVRYFAGPAWTDLNVRLLPGGGAEGVAET